jgi:hypothetical protein
MIRSTLPSLARRLAATSLTLLAPGAAVAAAAGTSGRGLPLAVWLLLLAPFVALGVGLHLVVARAVKQALLRWAPLPRGEQRIAGYERAVHDSVEPAMQAVIVLAFAAGAMLWAAAYAASALAWGCAAVTLLGAVVLDIALWQRVEVGAEHVWFQRRLFGTVHQVVVDNVRDVTIEQQDVAGLSLRHGRDNAIVRLKLRLKDRHVVALPKTGAYRGRADVEAVAACIEERLKSLRAEAAMRPKDADSDLKRALRRLRRNMASAANAA